SSALFGRAGFYDQHDVEGQAIMGQLHVRPDVMRREKMLNLGVVLRPHFKNLRASAPAALRQLLVKGPRYLGRHRSAKYYCYSSQTGGEPPKPFRQRMLEESYSECC